MPWSNAIIKLDKFDHRKVSGHSPSQVSHGFYGFHACLHRHEAEHPLEHPSALSRRYSVYEYHRYDGRLTPSRILPHPDIINNTAPQERWNYDVMTRKGEAKLNQLVGEIKVMTTVL
ncbi:hypothetical protein DFH94DRAFT_168602 [Russula ochroleuca]|uniref:Uncharacterized protein n=1 Tax=Russula ochroleuca TaxID=152965 RepID=A0A9P5N473_9AGAM|nr:hypothetical protein DFH94DRAFT_168602 [Russula ochroleuca]